MRLVGNYQRVGHLCTLEGVLGEGIMKGSCHDSGTSEVILHGCSIQG